MSMIRRNLGSIAVLVGGVALALLIAAIGPRTQPISQALQPVAVRTMPASKQTVRMRVTAHGEVLPKAESSLVAEVAGRVIAVSPAMVSGGFFGKGEVLVEIERIDYEAALEQARAHLASIGSELFNAGTEYRRLRELAERESVSESSLDSARNRLAIARASLREAKARVARAERDLERTRLIAPYDGRVRTERVDAGQFVNRGEAVATLYSIDFAEVRLPVHDDDLAFLPLSLARQDHDKAPMPKAILKARFSGAQRTWEAWVVRTEGELDPRTRMVNLIAQVKAPYDPSAGVPPLTVGLFVEAEIEGEAVEDVVVVPRSALHAGNRLYVVGADNRLIFRDVEVIRIADEVAYIGDGIEDGETICLSAIDSPVEGQSVRPIVRSSAPASQ